MPHPWPLPPWRVEQGQADVNLHRPNSEKLSVKGKKERPHHAGLGLLTAPGESRGWHLKLDDLCLEEVGFFYMGKNHAKKKKFFFFKRDTNSGSVSLLRHVLEAFVPVVHTGSTTGNLEWAKSLALTLYLMTYIHYAHLLPAAWTFLLIYHKGVSSPSDMLQNHFVWSMVCVSPTPQNHEHWGWLLDPSPQQTGSPCALLDCQNVDRNVLFFFFFFLNNVIATW